MTYPGDSDGLAHQIDPDDPGFDADDPRIIDGEAGGVGPAGDADGPRSRRFARFQQEIAGNTGSRKRKIILFLMFALGAALLALGLSSNCGGNGEQSTQETATAEAIASVVVETPTPTNTPKPAVTSTPTSVITPNPVVTVQADTGDPLGLTNEGGNRGLWLVVATFAITLACAWTFWKQTGPSRPQA